MFTLIPLPYAADALSPAISAETLGFHHGRHLQTYVTNLNNLLPGSGMEDLPLEEIVRRSEGAIANNAGQVLNHNLYFAQFRPAVEDNRPSGRLAEAIDDAFGSFEAFKAEFERQGTSLFGSGWVWLSADADGRLVITQESNAGNPVRRQLRPLLTFDVWEHAYYLDYQNRRAAHLSALWPLINWDEVARRYEE
jgi:Fe-Mn family superoxide dismutase